VRGDHHGAVIGRLLHELAGFERLEPRLAQQAEGAGKHLEVGTVRGVEDADAVQRHLQFFRHRADALFRSEQNRRAEPQRLILAGGLENARIRALWEHDALGVALELLDDGADEFHARSLAEDRAQRKGFAAWRADGGAGVPAAVRARLAGQLVRCQWQRDVRLATRGSRHAEYLPSGPD
jgi:hypothetical protein